MFKKIFPLAMLLFTVSTMAAEAQRRNPPDLWCRDDQLRYVSVPICSAYTLQQCLASRTGPSQRCYLNPRYQRDFNR